MHCNLNFILILLFVPLLFITACTETQYAAHLAKNMPGPSKSEGNFKVGNPYKVEGKTYVPQESYDHTETGIASWYGPGFHGKKTANGEYFNKNELTAAHRTLQMPSLVRVTNLENGRSLVVRINDRGPFKRGRVVDVSEKAAELLGFKGKGTAKVKLQVLTEESKKVAMAAQRGEDTRGVEIAMNESGYRAATAGARTGQSLYQPVSAQSEHMASAEIPGHMNDGRFMPDPVVRQMPVTPTSIYVQVGSFTQQDNAVRLASTLQVFGTARVYPVSIAGQPFFRVRLGPLSTVEQADTLLERLAAGGQTQAITIVE
jgi:rare lipoprotein A